MVFLLLMTFKLFGNILKPKAYLMKVIPGRKHVVWTKLDVSMFIATPFFIVSALIVSIPGDFPNFSDYIAIFNDNMVK